MVGPREEEDAPASALGDGPETPPPAESEFPAGPGEAEEESFLAAERAAAIPESRRAEGDGAEPAEGELPPMDDLVGRIPAPTRQIIDELFRARFVTVKRVPKSALK